MHAWKDSFTPCLRTKKKQRQVSARSGEYNHQQGPSCTTRHGRNELLVVYILSFSNREKNMAFSSRPNEFVVQTKRTIYDNDVCSVLHMRMRLHPPKIIHSLCINWNYQSQYDISFLSVLPSCFNISSGSGHMDYTWIMNVM